MHFLGRTKNVLKLCSIFDVDKHDVLLILYNTIRISLNMCCNGEGLTEVSILQFFVIIYLLVYLTFIYENNILSSQIHLELSAWDSPKV